MVCNLLFSFWRLITTFSISWSRSSISNLSNFNLEKSSSNHIPFYEFGNSLNSLTYLSRSNSSSMLNFGTRSRSGELNSESELSANLCKWDSTDPELYPDSWITDPPHPGPHPEPHLEPHPDLVRSSVSEWGDVLWSVFGSFVITSSSSSSISVLPTLDSFLDWECDDFLRSRLFLWICCLSSIPRASSSNFCNSSHRVSSTTILSHKLKNQTDALIFREIVLISCNGCG